MPSTSHAEQGLIGSCMSNLLRVIIDPLERVVAVIFVTIKHSSFSGTRVRDTQITYTGGKLDFLYQEDSVQGVLKV